MREVIRKIRLSMNSSRNLIFLAIFIVVNLMIGYEGERLANLISEAYSTHDIFNSIDLRQNIIVALSMYILLALITITFCRNLIIKLKENKWMGFPENYLIISSVIHLAISIFYYNRSLLSSFYFKYDALIFVLILSIVAYVVLLRKSSSIKSDSKHNLLEEKAITRKEQDILEYDRFANEIANRILNNEELQILSIVGENGSGKTSLCNLIRNHVEKEWMIMSFNPYHFDTEKDMAIALTQKIQDLLVKISPNPELRKIKEKFVTYIFRSNSIFSFWKRLISYIFRLDMESYNGHSLDEVFKAVGEEDVKILFFIDDLDRCSPSCRYYFYRLINVIRTLPNIKFLINTTVKDISRCDDPNLVSVVK